MASFLIHMNMEHGSNQFLYQTVIGLYILGVWQPQHTTLSNLPHQAHGETLTPTLMAAMIQSDLWERAQMDSVVHYLMANRHLQLPEYFKGILLQGINPWNIFWFEILIREHHCDFESQRWPVVQRSNKGSYDLAMGKMVHNDSWHSVKNVGFLVCLHYGIVFSFLMLYTKKWSRKNAQENQLYTQENQQYSQECARMRKNFFARKWTNFLGYTSPAQVHAEQEISPLHQLLHHQHQVLFAPTSAPAQWS